MAKRWQPDPKKTREENLWDVLMSALGYFIKMKGRKFNNFPGMTFNDIEHEVLVRAYPEIVKRLDAGWEKEHPDLGMWNLAFSCCLLAWDGIRYTFAQKYGRQLLNTVSIDAPVHDTDGITIADTIADGNHLTYRQLGVRVREEKRMKGIDDISGYLEDCIEFNLKPDPEFVESMLAELVHLPQPEEVPGFETMVKLMRTARYKTVYCLAATDWATLYRKYKNEPPKEFVYIVSVDGKKHMHREPNPAYRPAQAQPGRLPAKASPRCTS